MATANGVAEHVRAELYAGLGTADRRALARLLERLLADDMSADLTLRRDEPGLRDRRAPAVRD